VRLDHDEWHDVPILILDEAPEVEEGPVSAGDRGVNPAQAEAHPGQSSSSSSAGPLFSEAFWLVTDKGNIDFLEIFAGSQGLSYACYRSGLRVGQPIDKLGGIDLNTTEGRNYVWETITRQKPKMIFLAPPCTPWSQMQNINNQEMVEAQRRAAVPLLCFCLDVAKYQSSTGNYFIIENPSTSYIWRTKQFLSISCLSGVQWKNTDLCMFGLRDPVFNKHYHKR
jgi:hypothetical protein